MNKTIHKLSKSAAVKIIATFSAFLLSMDKHQHGKIFNFRCLHLYGIYNTALTAKQPNLNSTKQLLGYLPLSIALTV
jgi:hypothetical protein